MVDTCPWAAFRDPVVSDVLSYVNAIGDGGMASILIDDPPHAIWEGVALYKRALSDIRYNDEKKRDEERKRRRAADGES